MDSVPGSPFDVPTANRQNMNLSDFKKSALHSVMKCFMVMLVWLFIAGISRHQTLVAQVISPASSSKFSPQPSISPSDHLGYVPGADFRLASWKTVTEYFSKLDKISSNVVVETIGKSTQNRDMILVAISDSKTISNLNEVKRNQKLLADPRLIKDRAVEDRLVNESKPVVLITGTIHSSETAATFMLMELAHELASGQTAWAREVLEKVVVLIVPSVNPDGIDIVAEWYGRTLGKPWEGNGLPRLYHPYAGHDTNRDFFALNLVETQHLTKVMYSEWFPSVCWDVHQMGSDGARLFVPPFFDPTNPNVDPRITQSIMMIGSHMAADLASAGKKGVLHSAMYDNWWNGGNRTTPQRHNMVAILTEAASVRMASPIFLSPMDLHGKSRGFANHEPNVNFPDPWMGGWWRLRDIVDYELIAGQSLLTLTARYGKSIQGNYIAMGRDQIHKGETEAPYGWLIPQDQNDLGSAWKMIDTLRKTGIEVHKTNKPLTLHGQSYEPGTWYLPARQPYRAHLKDMMERQKYPDRFTTGGQAEPPYDVAGWTMPLLMGVKSVEIHDPIAVYSDKVETWVRPRIQVTGDLSSAKSLLIENRSMDDLSLIQILMSQGISPKVHSESTTVDGRKFLAGFVEIEASEKLRKIITELSERISTQIYATKSSIAGTSPKYRLKSQRIAVYQPWEPSMDEGWTRLVLDRIGIPYTTIHRDDLLAGKLNDRFDCLLFPSVSARALRNGFKVGETEPGFVGGIAGSREILKEFASRGGTIVGLENSSEFLISELGLPVEDSVASLPTKDFYGPGSLIGAEISGTNPLGFGMPEKFSLYFDRSLAFKSAAKATNDSNTKFDQVVVYSRDSGTLLQSGWLLGPEKISGLAALGECRIGQGRVILFGFPPQNRAQTTGTFRLLVNSLWRGGLTRIDPANTADFPRLVPASEAVAKSVGLVK